MTTSKPNSNPLARDYGVALEDYLTRGQEASLKKGCELGQDALIQGNGIIDMIEIHNRAAEAVLPSAGRVPQLRGAFKRCGRFLTEFVSGVCKSTYAQLLWETQMRPCAD